MQYNNFRTTPDKCKCKGAYDGMFSVCQECGTKKGSKKAGLLHFGNWPSVPPPAPAPSPATANALPSPIAPVPPPSPTPIKVGDVVRLAPSCGSKLILPSGGAIFKDDVGVIVRILQNPFEFKVVFGAFSPNPVTLSPSHIRRFF